MTETTYHTLLDPEDLVLDEDEQYVPGQTVHGPVLAGGEDPRKLNLTEALEAQNINTDDLDDIVRRERAVLAVVKPLGEITDETDGYGEYTCADGWTVERVLPLHMAYGPQAEQIDECLKIAREKLGEDNGLMSRYQDVAERRVDNDLFDSAIEAAEDALTGAGFDGYFWSAQESCAYGVELLALAARDLIVTEGVSHWTQAAYDELTRVWRTVLPDHPLHPEDAPLPEGVTA